jgi:hypothetical protein
MPHFRRAAIVPVLIVLCQHWAAASQFPDFDPQAIDRAIAQLSSDDWHRRRDAVRELARLGPQVEARLDDLLDGPLTPELRLRIREARRLVDPMRRIEPTLITLNLRDADAKTAFDQVAWQQGAALPCEPRGLLNSLDASVTANFVRRPYWDVILELCRQTGLRLRCNEAGVTLVRATASAARRETFAVNGLFLVTPSRLRSVGEVGPGLRISIYAEPRACVLRSDAPLTVSEAVDRRGRSLISESALNAGGASLSNGYCWSAGLSPMALPDSVLSDFRGTAQLILAESMQTFEAPGASTEKSLTDPMPIQFSAGSVSMSILRIVESGGEYLMDMRLATDPAEVDWAGLMFSLDAGGLRAFDIDGRELQLVHVQHDGAAPADNIRVRWQSRISAATRPTSEPFKLIWRFPAKTVHVTVPFELKDVKLR